MLQARRCYKDWNETKSRFINVVLVETLQFDSLSNIVSLASNTVSLVTYWWSFYMVWWVPGGLGSWASCVPNLCRLKHTRYIYGQYLKHGPYFFAKTLKSYVPWICKLLLIANQQNTFRCPDQLLYPLSYFCKTLHNDLIMKFKH